MITNPTIFLPVENQVRELDAKLFFACVAAERGFPVVFGQKQRLYLELPRFAPGIFVAKSMRARSKLMFDIIRGLGHELLAWDEESLVRFDSPEYYAWRFSPSTFNSIRHLFAWGDDDAEMFAAYPGNQGVAVHATGNPRLDLLRPELGGYFADACAELTRAYGDYVLVNTNFSFANPFLDDVSLVRRDGSPGRAGFGLSATFAREMKIHQELIFEQFKVLLPALAARFPDTCIVLRPHPSEDHETWRNLLAGYTNVVVCHEGNVIPWLMSARVLVHNGCTTAVEGSLAGVPAVAYRPVQSPVFDYRLPNSLSHQTTTVDETLATVGEIVNGTRGQVDENARTDLYSRHLAAAHGAFASERIVAKLESLGYASQTRPPVAPLKRMTARAKATVRAVIKRRNMRRHDHWASDRYNAHVFPSISEMEINARIARFSRTLPGRFTRLRARQCGDSLFTIEGEREDRGHGAPA